MTHSVISVSVLLLGTFELFPYHTATAVAIALAPLVFQNPVYRLAGMANLPQRLS